MMAFSSAAPTVEGAGSQPLRLRRMPAALAAILATLGNRHFQFAIGAQSWQLQIAGVLAAATDECIDCADSDRSELPICIEGTWLGHGFAIWCQPALLYRTLHAALPAMDAAAIPPTLFDAVALNAAAIWLAALPDQDSLHLTGINLTGIRQLAPVLPALEQDRGTAMLRLHGCARQTATGAAYPVAIDISTAFSAVLGRLLPTLVTTVVLSHPPWPALLDLPLRLQCEVGYVTLPYKTLATLRQGDVLFFDAYTEPEAEGLGALGLRLCYRAHALARASIQQSGQMVITGIDMNDSKSISYEDDLPEDAATAFYGSAEDGRGRSGNSAGAGFGDDTGLDAENIDIFGAMDDFGISSNAAFDPPSDTTGRQSKVAPDGATLRAGLAQLPLQLVFDIGECEMNMSELQALHVGSVIKLASQISEVVRVTINGRMIASGELVEVDGKIGVILARLTDNP